jgi:putative ATP-binding cassette transporter
MILGTLTEQLIYPYNYTDIKEERLYEVIEKVGLSYLTERFGGLNIQQDWSEILSLGEQQRLAFGRFLIAKPKYVILDEATSALDINNEEKLYNFLREMSTTFVSVGHRPTLRKFHQVVINLSGESL